MAKAALSAGMRTMTMHTGHLGLIGQQPPTVPTQNAALCYRITKGKPEVLLITSRGTGRWVLPKGWPIDGLSPAAGAAQEAWEEAGVKGTVRDDPIGRFVYAKVLSAKRIIPCLAHVFALQVSTLADKFPEAGQRQRAWFSPKKAATRVDEPELAALLRRFDPRDLA